jgi:hypothetical protein
LVHLILVLRKQILTKLLAPLGLFLEQLDKGKCFSDWIVRKVSALQSPCSTCWTEKLVVYVAVDLELTVDNPIFGWVVGQVLVVKSSLIGWGNYVHITRPTNNAG